MHVNVVLVLGPFFAFSDQPHRVVLVVGPFFAFLDQPLRETSCSDLAKTIAMDVAKI